MYRDTTLIGKKLTAPADANSKTCRASVLVRLDHIASAS
jgi:hypothetical protein